MIRIMKFALAALVASTATQASAISVALGASTETFTLFGRGPIAAGIGSFDVGQGAGSFDGTTSTFTLTGAITGGDAGYDTGTYRFVTTYLGAATPDAGTIAPFAQSNPGNLAFFFYRSLHPSTAMTLFLDTPGSDYAIPLVVGGSFVPGTGFFFLFTTATCTGVAGCVQNEVGLTPGATISGPVTISANFTALPAVGGIPEPATWVMLAMAFGLVGVSARARRQFRHTSA